jgi:hypothetical protein
LRAEGYSIPDAPSESAWVDAVMDNRPIWTPFKFVIDGVQMDNDTYYALFNKCPQDGPTATLAQ